MKPRWILFLAQICFLIAGWSLFVARHGGWQGNLKWDGDGYYDTVSGDFDPNFILFNKWSFIPEESWTIMAFALLKAPAVLTAKMLICMGMLLSDEMESFAPYGLSAFSYNFVVMLPLSLLQWYWSRQVG